jgi:hypothetical protein
MTEFWSNPKSTDDTRIKKLLNLANGMPCMYCGNQDGTVVAAHQNEGKGYGLKRPDYMTAYLCGSCHFELDNGKELTKQERRNLWNAAYVKTSEYWWKNGIIGVLK